MLYLTKKYILSLLLFTFFLSLIEANDKNLYTCNFHGKSTTYHENDTKRMILLGADCRIMHNVEHITCAMDGVKVDYAIHEAEDLLYRHPDAYCEMNSRLFRGKLNNTSSLALEKTLVVYFPIKGTSLSYKDRKKISTFARQYRNMGYKYTITGHASATGKSSSNYLLSLKRAGSVRSMLLNNGIHGSNILSVDALGEESLRYNTAYEFRLNRAVEIKVYK